MLIADGSIPEILILFFSSVYCAMHRTQRTVWTKTKRYANNKSIKSSIEPQKIIMNE